MHPGNANRKGHCKKGLVTVFVVHVFTMGCILSCLLLPDGGDKKQQFLCYRGNQEKRWTLKELTYSYTSGLVFLRVLDVSFPRDQPHTGVC